MSKEIKKDSELYIFDNQNKPSVKRMREDLIRLNLEQDFKETLSYLTPRSTENLKVVVDIKYSKEENADRIRKYRDLRFIEANFILMNLLAESPREKSAEEDVEDLVPGPKMSKRRIPEWMKPIPQNVSAEEKKKMFDRETKNMSDSFEASAKFDKEMEEVRKLEYTSTSSPVNVAPFTTGLRDFSKKKTDFKGIIERMASIPNTIEIKELHKEPLEVRIKVMMLNLYFEKLDNLVKITSFVSDMNAEITKMKSKTDRTDEVWLEELFENKLTFQQKMIKNYLIMSKFENLKTYMNIVHTLLCSK